MLPQRLFQIYIQNWNDHISAVYRRERFPFRSTSSSSTSSSSGVLKETKVYLISLILSEPCDTVQWLHITQTHTHTHYKTTFLRMPWRIPSCTCIISSMMALESHDQTRLSTCADSMPSSYFTLFQSVNITGLIYMRSLGCLWNVFGQACCFTLFHRFCVA